MQVKEFGFVMDLLYDITMTDILILQQINKYNKPTIRFSIFEDINTQLPHARKLTSTKFYYTLNRFEKLKLISSKPGIKKRTVLISKTYLLVKAIRAIYQSTIINSIDFTDALKPFIPYVIKELGVKIPFDKLLVVINKDECIIDPKKIEIFSELSNKLHILSTKHLFDYYVKRHPDKNYYYTQMEDTIREANETFDLILYINFEQKQVGIIDELLRVKKKDGVLILASSDEIKEQENFILQSVKLHLSEFINEELNPEFLEKHILPPYNYRLLSKHGYIIAAIQ